jgi:hypothetical protein
MPSDHVVALCNDTERTIIRALEKDPRRAPLDVAKELFSKARRPRSIESHFKKQYAHTPADLDLAEKCGRFPYRPSDLFLKVGIESSRLSPPDTEHSWPDLF